MIKRALLSVSDKSHLVPFANALIQADIEIIATGGTARLLKKHQIPITDVATITQFPEIMDGRVKTLHPLIHGGILARRGIDDAVMDKHDIQPIDLVVVNLYPFQATVNQPNVDFATAIEHIDIGGPTLLRAAAKNHEYVSVVVDPGDYEHVLAEIHTHQDTTLATRRHLAQKTFAHTAQYDRAIALYFQQQCTREDNPSTPTLPDTLLIDGQQVQALRYGENPHQAAAFYHADHTTIPNGTVGHAKLLQGKPLSYNNMIDADAALRCAQGLDLQQPGCVIIKHATPCGVAQAHSAKAAYLKALATDSQSAFGGIIAFNCTLDADTASSIVERQFAEVVIAPSIDEAAIPILSKKPNCRVLACGFARNQTKLIDYRSISGGILAQTRDVLAIDPSTFTVVTQRQPTASELTDLIFAWRVVTFVKSNAIVYAKDQQTLGIGTGQTSRVFSAEIAVLKAQAASLSLDGAAVASDAFFPFADSIEVAAQVGIRAVIQPGGSKRDTEVIAKADALGLTMVLTHQRHFLH